MNNHEFPDLLDQYKTIIKLWSIRTLYDLRGYSKIDLKYDLDDHERIFNILDLKYLIDKYDDDRRLKKKKFKKILTPISKEFEAIKAPQEGALFKNTDELGRLTGLNETEKQLLIFGVLINAVSELEDVLEILGNISPHGIANVLSIILNINRTDVRKAIAKDGLLNRTGLFTLERTERTHMIYHITVMNDISGVLLDEDKPDIMKSLTRFFSLGEKPKLKPEDYNHIKLDYKLLYTYLKSTVEKRSKGVNILIYGPPGTGKTEMVRTLSNDLDFVLYDVTTGSTDDDEDAYRSRLDSYRLCQQVLKRKTDTLILFDEIEDAFIRDGSMERFGIRTSTDAKKGSYNHLLEVNPLPTIWVSNVVSHIDEAIIRRFDYVMELKIPPRSTRINIIKKYAKELNVSEKWIDQISINENLAPALISRAVKVVKELGKTEPAKTEANMERVLSNTLSAMGYDKVLSNPHFSPITYRLDALNPDYDLESLQKALHKKPEGRFCLYGPSGTGKSEFARHLAKALDMPLLIKRASDLLDPYIGMTERNISEMFEQSKEEEALLLLDEADSFLRDRNRSRESWEITQVNELLTQIEQFQGLFFCTTNLMETLDQASLRRFDLKIKFDYLKPAQSWTLFKQTLKDHQEVESDLDEWESKVFGLQGVTPGDYATAARQNRFSGKPMGAESLYKGLQKEIEFKQYGAFKGMGFINV